VTTKLVALHLLVVWSQLPETPWKGGEKGAGRGCCNPDTVVLLAGELEPVISACVR